MKLFYAPLSPFARKCRIVAFECGLSDKIEEITVLPADDPPELIATNPIVQVPSLVLDDGRSVIGSDMICSFLIAMSGNTSLYKDALGLEERRLEAFGDAAGEVSVKLRYELMRPPQRQFPDHISRLQNHIKRALEYNDSIVTPNDYNIGTIAILCALDYSELRHPDLISTLNLPNLRALQAQMAQKEIITRTRPQ